MSKFIQLVFAVVFLIGVAALWDEIAPQGDLAGADITD